MIFWKKPSLWKVFFFSHIRPLFQSRVCPTSRPPLGLSCPRITQKAMGTIWTACGWSSPSREAEFSWLSMTSTWSHPTTSWRCGTVSSWAASRAPRCPHTSPATPTSCSWSSRRITPCPAEASTSLTVVSKAVRSPRSRAETMLNPGFDLKAFRDRTVSKKILLFSIFTED